MRRLLRRLLVLLQVLWLLRLLLLLLVPRRLGGHEVELHVRVVLRLGVAKHLGHAWPLRGLGSHRRRVPIEGALMGRVLLRQHIKSMSCWYQVTSAVQLSCQNGEAAACQPETICTWWA